MQGFQVVKQRDHFRAGDFVRLAVHHRAVGQPQRVVDVDVHLAVVAFQLPRVALAEAAMARVRRVSSAPCRTAGISAVG
jgi:hypothetical protein